MLRQVWVTVPVFLLEHTMQIVPDYIELLNFEKRHNLTPSNALLMFTNGEKNISKGKDLLKYSNSEQLAVLFSRFKFSFAKTNSFANALKYLINNNIDSISIEFLVANQYQIVQAATRDLYLKQFEIILNKRRGRVKKVNFID